MTVVLSGGERHESRYVAALLAGGRVRHGIRAVIPRRSDQRPDDGRHGPSDHVAYRERNRVERLVNRFKQYRRVATRYEKRAAHHLAMLTVAAVLLWL